MLTLEVHDVKLWLFVHITLTTALFKYLAFVFDGKKVQLTIIPGQMIEPCTDHSV